MTRNRFKAGDVVKPSGRVYDLRVGGEYTVESQAAPTDMAWIMLRGHHNPSTTDGSYPEDRFEPARCAQPAGVQIEEGKFYRTAAGDKVGPMVAWRVDRGLFHVQSGPCVGGLWKPDGTAEYPGAGDSPTLIAECREAQPGDRIRMLRNDGAGGYKAGDHFVTVNGETFIDNDGDSRPLDGHPHKVVGAAEKPLRVGDRVRAIGGRPCGHTGTIIEDVGDGMPLVKFDDWHGGHDGNGECGDSGYWCHEGDFERIEESGFKKGDRVRALGDVPKGKAGTVAAVNGGGIVLVAFDNWRSGHDGIKAGLSLDGSGWWLRPADLERIEEPKFKVGDRISGEAFGLGYAATGRVKKVDSEDPLITYDVELDDGRGSRWLRTATCRAAPLRVEAGNHYRTQSGAVIGPMMDFGGGRFIKEFGDGNIWRADGKRHCGTLGDIVAEVAAPAPDAKPEAAKPEPAFKVGDRVRAVANSPSGLTGTVVEVGRHILVDYDGWREGHTGTDDQLPKESGWYMSGDEIEHVAAPAAAFKVGDRVRFTDRCPRTWWFGPHTKYKEGVITADDGEGKYDVETGAMFDPAFVCSPDQIEPAPVRPAPHAIVALIKSGKPKPSPTPRVHPDRTTAAMEAERLARVYPGKEYGVYELAETRSQPAPKCEHEWQRLAAAGKRNDAVSELMRVAGVAASSAFSAADRFRNAA